MFNIYFDFRIGINLSVLIRCENIVVVLLLFIYFFHKVGL